VSSLAVIRAGIATTVQDLGRPGWARLGVPPGGALDGVAARLANRLAGNPDGAGLLEVTAGGLEMEALDAVAVAVTGAAGPLRISGRAAQTGRTLALGAGDVVELGRAETGFRFYVAFAGGIDVPLALGSRSTLLSAGFGGLDGRRLAAGDRLSTGARPPAVRRHAAHARPLDGAVRAVPVPDEGFSESELSRFFASTFRVSALSDRAGLRLDGADFPASPGRSERPTEGAFAGCVQVPGGGAPIVLLADGPVTGGYPKIAVVATADLPLLAQRRPASPLSFVRICVEDAVAALAEEDAWLETVEE
jgi:biotin-dependent carboxylase-like uncharacterized protein